MLSNNNVDPEMQQLIGEKSLKAAEFASDFFSKLCTAARKDGRTLDPLWRDLANEADDESERCTNSSVPEEERQGSAYYTTKLVLCQTEENDSHIYVHFRSQLEDFSVATIPDNTVLSQDAWNILQALTSTYLNGTSTLATLLRPDVMDMNVSEKLWVVPRFQFMCIEVCRIREGLYDRTFRRALEVFDLQTQSDRLESSLRRMTAEERALDALCLLRTQWPNPSLSAMKQSQVVSVVQAGVREGCSEAVRSKCQALLDYWKEMKELGKIAMVLQIGGHEAQQLRPALERAGAALIDSKDGETQCTLEVPHPANMMHTNDSKLLPPQQPQPQSPPRSEPLTVGTQRKPTDPPTSERPAESDDESNQTGKSSPNASKHHSKKPISDEHDAHSKLLLLSRLRQLLTRSQSVKLLSTDESYGHPFFTDRFELLLLESFLSEDTGKQAIAKVNMAAVIHFCTLSEGDKETTAREFVYNLGDLAHDRKEQCLQKNQSKRERNVEQHDALDYQTIVCKLTTTILLEESVLLSKLGFTSDQNGISVLLAMLKAHAARDALGCIGITVGQLEEAFLHWWYQFTDRFSFHPGRAVSPEEQAKRKLLVVFCTLDTEGNITTDWSESIQAATTAYPKLDVLQVLDPSISFFCQDPEGQWKGISYYRTELEELITRYPSRMFLGHSSGASAALRLSDAADNVLAFAPLVRLPTACQSTIRVDIPQSVCHDFQEDLIHSMKQSVASISVHYARVRKEQRVQVKLLPTRKNIEFVAHEIKDLSTTSTLQETGSVLRNVVDKAIEDFVKDKTRRLPS